MITMRVSPYSQNIMNTNKDFPFNYLCEYILFLILWLDAINLELISNMFSEPMAFNQNIFRYGIHT